MSINEMKKKVTIERCPNGEWVLSFDGKMWIGNRHEIANDVLNMFCLRSAVDDAGAENAMYEIEITRKEYIYDTK